MPVPARGDSSAACAVCAHPRSPSPTEPEPHAPAAIPTLRRVAIDCAASRPSAAVGVAGCLIGGVVRQWEGCCVCRLAVVSLASAKLQTRRRVTL